MSINLARTAHLSRNAVPRRTGSPVVAGAGAVFRDAAAVEYVDLSSQTVNLLYGQAHPFITDRVVERLRRYTFFDQDLECPHDLEALALLQPLLPPGLTAVNFKLSNGSDAVECAVKQARRATGGSRIITAEGIYLGQSTQTINLRGLGPHPSDIVRGSMEDVVFAPRPYCPAEDHDPLTCPIENGEAICALVDAHLGELAAVLLDPIMVTSGVFGGRAMPALLRRVRAHTEALGVPLLLDESQTFGWVPEHTLASHWGVFPDALVLAKGVAGGFPLAVCATREELDVLEWGEADFTHGGHPVSVAAMAATCTLLADETEQKNFDALVEALDSLLAEDCGGLIRTRGIGLIRAVEVLVDGRVADPAMVRRIADRCFAQGVYVRQARTALSVKPPRVITVEQLERAFAVLREAIGDEIGRMAAADVYG